MPVSKRPGFLLILPVMLAFLFAMIWLTKNGVGETWAYFSNFEDQLLNITTGFWSSPPPQAGTSIEAQKTAAGFWEQLEGRDRFGVRGEICVTNEGDFPTENLTILDMVQFKIGAGDYVDYMSTLVDVSAFPILAPGESHCYPYEIEFTPVEGARYRNLARVTITNHSGWLPGGENCSGPDPCPYGPQPKAGFRLPRKPSDRNGKLPISPEPSPTPTLTPADRSGGGEDADLEPHDTISPSPAIETITPTPTASPSPTFPPTPTTAPTQSPFGMCTHSVDYWRSHPANWPVSEISLGGKWYSFEEALEWLGTPYDGDVSIYLVQQLIAARLNIANGTDPSSISDQLAVADEWLAGNPPGSAPKGRAARSGRSIAEGLEAYNLGSVGPGLCQEDFLPTPAPTQAPYETATWTPTFAATLTPTETSLPSATPTPVSTPTPTPEEMLPSPTLPTPAPTQSTP